MITNTGKDILSKFLLGHTSSYASHIAVGSGAVPLGALDDPITNASIYEQKQNLDFEMFRVPITSRGYVKEDGLTYVVLTAELPTTERYGITEVGIYSAGSNPEAGVADSKLIKSFSSLEGWEQHNQALASAIPNIAYALDSEGDDFIDVTDKFFTVSSDNPTFLYPDRVERHEVPRFLDSSIVVRGDSSVINKNNDGNLIPDDTVSSHIHLTGTSLNLDQNAPTDELRLAFSLINKDGDGTEIPGEVRVVIEFTSGEGGDRQYAIMEAVINETVDDIDFDTNRYFVVSRQLQELRKSIGFSWDQVNTIKAYASVVDGDSEISENFYVAFDGLRLENTTSIHPLYGLTGYSVIKTDDASPIIKSKNSSSFVEFRFAFQLDEYSSVS